MTDGTNPIRRYGACCRLGEAFHSPQTYNLREAAELRQRIGTPEIKTAVERCIAHTIQSQSGASKQWTYLAPSSKYREFTFQTTNEPGPSSALGFSFDFSEMLFLLNGNTFFSITPSLSIGFTIETELTKITWPSPPYRGDQNDIVKKSAWKLWLQIYSNCMYTRVPGLGFPDFSQFINYCRKSNLVYKTFNEITKHILRRTDSISHTNGTEICIVSSSCYNTKRFTSMHGALLDSSNSKEVIEHQDKSIRQQFIDIDHELKILSLKDSNEPRTYLWCTLEEGVAALFGRAHYENSLFYVGIAVDIEEPRGGGLRGRMLSQGDRGYYRNTPGLLAADCVVNEIVRWF